MYHADAWFFMYLKKLYKQHKGWFIIVVIFSAAQIINNVRQDIAFSPVYQYGMYSEYLSPKDTLYVYDVIVNGKQLQASNFSPQQWDKISLPLRYYANSYCNNSNIYTNIKRLLQKISIVTDSSNYVFPFDETGFMNWYKPYLSGMIKQNISSLQVNYSLYKFDTLFQKIKTGLFTQTCK